MVRRGRHIYPVIARNVASGRPLDQPTGGLLAFVPSRVTAKPTRHERKSTKTNGSSTDTTTVVVTPAPPAAQRDSYCGAQAAQAGTLEAVLVYGLTGATSDQAFPHDGTYARTRWKTSSEAFRFANALLIESKFGLSGWACVLASYAGGLPVSKTSKTGS